MSIIKSLHHLLRHLLFGIGFTPIWLTAQVNINAQLPPGGMVQKEQLWNLTIVNTLKDFTEVTIKLTLQDAITGQVVMSSNTGSFVLSKGVKIITNAAIQPAVYNYYTAVLPGNFLPMGSYIACYGVYYMRGESEEFLSEECTRFTIDPLSPPLLATPADKDTLQTPSPLFTWMPPTPVTMFSDLTYDIIIAEVMDGQSSGEAIEQNTPVYTGNNLTRPNENYPAGFAKLESGKTYAWQIIARNGFSYAVKTEAWTFTIGNNPKPVATPLNSNYLLLENDLKDTYVISNKELQIKFTSFDAAHEAPLVFSDIHRNKVATINKKIAQGDNYFTIPLSNQFQKGIIYTVTITDMQGKGHAILFRIK